jgi:hypothetical protein
MRPWLRPRRRLEAYCGPRRETRGFPGDGQPAGRRRQAARVTSRPVRHPRRRGGLGAGRWRAARVGLEGDDGLGRVLHDLRPARSARARHGLDPPGWIEPRRQVRPLVGVRGRVAALGRRAGGAALVTRLERLAPDPVGSIERILGELPRPCHWLRAAGAALRPQGRPTRASTCHSPRREQAARCTTVAGWWWRSGWPWPTPPPSVAGLIRRAWTCYRWQTCPHRP